MSTLESTYPIHFDETAENINQLYFICVEDKSITLQDLMTLPKVPDIEQLSLDELNKISEQELQKLQEDRDALVAYQEEIWHRIDMTVDKTEDVIWIGDLFYLGYELAGSDDDETIHTVLQRSKFAARGLIEIKKKFTSGWHTISSPLIDEIESLMSLSNPSQYRVNEAWRVVAFLKEHFGHRIILDMV